MEAPQRAAGRAGRLYLHVGLAKTGTTFVQATLADSRPRLRDAGFLYPFVRPEGMFHAAVEVRGDHGRWGLDPAVVEGTWAALLDKARGFGGTAVISHEILAGASVDQIGRAAEQLHGFDVHLVVTTRDPARQVPAHWQEAVKNGETLSFAEFTAEVLRLPGAPDTGFWNEQDLVGVLRRWASVVPPDHVHVVVGPPRGADRGELWRRFALATGVPADLAETAPARPGNESLGVAEVHLLRAVNRLLGGAAEGELGQPAYAHVVKRFFAQRVLASARDSPPAVTPEELREPLTALATQWQQHIAAAGYRVYGDLGELLPTEFGTEPHPDEAPAVSAPDGVARIVAELLREIARLRQERPVGAAAIDGPSEAPAGAEPSRGGRWARVLSPRRQRAE